MIEGARGREAESPRGAAPREPPRETHSSERRLARDLLELEVVPALLLLGGLEDVARVDFALLGKNVAARDLDVVVRERLLEPGVVDDLVDLAPLAHLRVVAVRHGRSLPRTA